MDAFSARLECLRLACRHVGGAEATALAKQYAAFVLDEISSGAGVHSADDPQALPVGLQNPGCVGLDDRDAATDRICLSLIFGNAK